MDAGHATILPYAVAALAAFVIYRRLRRSFGRQLFSRARMTVRIGILAVLGASLLPLALHSAEFLACELAGIAAGAALGVWGSRRTRFQKVEGRLYFVPHTGTGVLVSLLLIGRLAYRLVTVYEAGRTGAGSGGGAGFDGHSLMSTPLTVGLVFAVVGYYVSYFGLILRRSRRLGPEDLELISRPASVST